MQVSNLVNISETMDHHYDCPFLAVPDDVTIVEHGFLYVEDRPVQRVKLQMGRLRLVVLNVQCQSARGPFC